MSSVDHFHSPPTIAPDSGGSSIFKWLLSLGGIGALALLWSCGRSMYRNYGICRAATEHFHQELNQGEYESIYSQANDEFRSAVPKSDEIKVLELVHERMGNAGKMSAAGFHINATTRGTFVNQVYETQFVGGQVQEEFVWRVENGAAALVRYHAESPNFR
jgi:hypothetical protein